MSHWKNSITIFKHAIEVTDIKYPAFAPANYNLGLALLDELKPEEAISQFKIAIKLNPNYAQAQSNLKTALQQLEKIEGF